MLVNIDIHRCIIEGAGNLHIDGQINANRKLIIRSASLKFTGSIFCGSKCVIKTNQLTFGGVKNPTNVNLVGEQLIFAKNCILNNTQFVVKGQNRNYYSFMCISRLYIAANAKFKVEKNFIKAKKIYNNGSCDLKHCSVESDKILLNEAATIINSRVTASRLQAFKQVNINKSKFVIDKLFACYDGAKIKDTKIKSNLVIFDKDLDIQDLKIRADELQFSSNQAIVRKCRAYSKFLVIDGGNKYDAVDFHDCRFVTENFVEENHITLINSAFIGIGNKKDTHNICGHLRLKKSRYITNGQVHTLKQSSIEVNNCSILQTSHFDSQAKITVKQSFIFGSSLSQQDAQLNISDSQIDIKKNFYSTNSSSYILNNSTLNADKIHFGSKDKLCLANNSSLVGRQRISSKKNSKFLGINSYIETDNFVLQGTTGLSKSMLQYGQLHIKKNATLVLKESKSLGENLINCGNLRITESIVETENEFLTQSIGVTILRGNNIVKTNSMPLEGRLVTENSLINEKNQQGNVSQLKITGQFDISNRGEINGGANLIVDANYVSNAGKINLRGNFFAKGRQLKNCGEITADKEWSRNNFPF